MESTAKLRLEKIYKQSKLKKPYTKMSLASRYWIYQSERLPLIPLLLMGVSLGTALMLANNVFSFSRLIISTVLVSAYLLQIRFADEPKDYEHDNEFYPNRPVQRGVITLTELKNMRNWSITVFFLAALSVQSLPIFLLACLQQLYSLLTRKEFFIRNWLRNHFLLYMFSHYFQLIILNWLALSILEIPRSERLYFMGFTLLLTAIVELARKTNAGDNDQAGDTYSATLGRSKASAIYLALTGAGVLYSISILNRINGNIWALVIILAAFAITAYSSLSYVKSPSKKNTNNLQIGSLLYYLMAALTIIIGS